MAVRVCKLPTPCKDPNTQKQSQPHHVVLLGEVHGRVWGLLQYSGSQDHQSCYRYKRRSACLCVCPIVKTWRRRLGWRPRRVWWSWTRRTGSPYRRRTWWPRSRCARPRSGSGSDSAARSGSGSGCSTLSGCTIVTTAAGNPIHCTPGDSAQRIVHRDECQEWLLQDKKQQGAEVSMTV